MSTALVKGLAVLALVAGIVFAYSWWRGGVFEEGHAAGNAEVQALWDAENLQRAARAIQAGEEFRKQERRDAAKAKEIEDYARKREKLAAAAAAGSKSSAGGLSGDIAALDASARSRGLPSASACPVEFERQRDSAIFARELLGQCGQRYQAVAETADGIRLKLETALGYIAIVAPAQD